MQTKKISTTWESITEILETLTFYGRPVFINVKIRWEISINLLFGYHDSVDISAYK